MLYFLLTSTGEGDVDSIVSWLEKKEGVEDGGAAWVHGVLIGQPDVTSQ
jgi:hypothetical protein